MNRLFWQTVKLAPILFAATFLATNSVSAEPISAEKEEINQALEQINNYQQLEQNDLSQVTNVNQLRDVSPTDWAYEALRSLVDRYGCISGFPNQTYRGNQPLSRYEFAAGLNSCLNQIERLIASQESIGEEDLNNIRILSQEFEAELATIAGRVDELESRTAFLEDNQFSTTTKLKGEVVFAIADAFGGDVVGTEDDVDDVSDNAETTFSSRVRLNFDTSFFGKDRLRTRLQGGNFIQINDDVTGTDSTRLGFDNGGGFDIEIFDLHYRFPVNKRAKVWIGTEGLNANDIFDDNNPELASSGDGALSRFNRRDPILFRGTGGSGVGVNLDLIEDKLELSGLYLADDANDPTSGNGIDTQDEGLFSGSFSAGAQLVFNPVDSLKLSATYIRNYQTAGVFDAAGNEIVGDDIGQSGGTVSGFASEPFGDGVDTTANKIGAGVSFDLNERIVLGGFAGYADVEGLVDGDDNNQSGDIWTWSANISILDLIKEGSRFSVAGGMLPKFISEDAVPEGQAGLQEDQDTSYIIEALYKFPVNDHIAITPGAYAVFNPNHIDENDTVYVGVVRTTFKF